MVGCSGGDVDYHPTTPTCIVKMYHMEVQGTTRERGEREAGQE